MNTSQLAEKILHAHHVLVLSGAGISSESGLPTFRGTDGYWTLGSRNYHPMELATSSAFSKDPELVWKWYHYRRNVYSQAIPNEGHKAIAQLEKYFDSNEDKYFNLITQNVDGLHLVAGSSEDCTFQIHGNIFYMRCTKECSTKIYPIKTSLGVPSCPKCGEIARPHVLWFDEFYNEGYYKYQSSLNLSKAVDVLLIVGTSVQTNLPYQIILHCLARKILIIDVNPQPIGLSQYGVIEIKGKSGEILPELIREIQKIVET
ncbi:MAG: NAD-dependent deacetylase [Candidatus Thorarchaeota archaeon]